MSHDVNLSRLEEEAKRALLIAERKGAETVAATIHEKSDFQVEIRNGEIETLSEADYHGVSITLSKDGKRATVSSCDTSSESIERLVDEAMIMCRYTDRDPHYSLPEKELLAGETSDLDLFDPKVVELDVKEKIAMALELERETLAVSDQLKPDGTSMSSLMSAGALANSLGFCGSKLSGLVEVGTMAFAEDKVEEGDLNKGRKQIGSWFSRARHLEDLDSLRNVAQTAANRVLRRLGARKPRTGKFPVYFEPAIARSLLNSLVTATSGTQVYRKESYLADCLGETIAASSLNIIDDPTIMRGLGSRSFDAEGVATQRRHILKDGRLESFLLGTYSANKLGLRSTGNAGGASNLIVEPGTLTEEEMLAQMGTGVWITSLLGQGVNISTGDYSRGGFGIWVENGKPQYPIMEFTVNSNLDTMFKNIVMLGNNVLKGSTILTPGFVVDEMTISGE